jgi:hypothetical protein
MKASHCILIGLLGTAAFVGPSTAAKLTLVRVKGKHAVIQLSGRIDQGDSDTFVTLLQKAIAANQLIDSVQLNSTGGMVGEGAKIAAMIRTAKLSTQVGEGAICASACFLVFAAGEKRFAASGAFIGVHKASEKNGRESSQSAAATLAMAGFARELGVPSAITAKMMATPPARIQWLDSRDLKAMGVAVGSTPAPGSQVATGEAMTEAAHNDSNSTAMSPARVKVAAASAWTAFIDKVMALSAEQNQGRPSIHRRCLPESKECVMSVTYQLQDGRQGLALMAQDGNGDITRREVCESNTGNDARKCRDWDTGATYQDTKNSKGEWSQVQE